MRLRLCYLHLSVTVGADNNAFFHFNDDCVVRDTRRNRPDGKLFLPLVEVVIVKAARVALRAYNTTDRGLVVPQPLLLLCDGHYCLFSIAVLTNEGVIFPPVCAVRVSLAAETARMRCDHGWRNPKVMFGLPFMPPWQVASWKILLHAFASLRSIFTRASTVKTAPRKERLFRCAQLHWISPTEKNCVRPPRLLFTCCVR
jgi:hypothetical protein